MCLSLLESWECRNRRDRTTSCRENVWYTFCDRPTRNSDIARLLSAKSAKPKKKLFFFSILKESNRLKWQAADLLPAEIAQTDIDELRQDEIVHGHGIVDDDVDCWTGYFDWRRLCCGRQRWRRTRTRDAINDIRILIRGRRIVSLVRSIDERQNDVAITKTRIETQLMARWILITKKQKKRGMKVSNG